MLHVYFKQLGIMEYVRDELYSVVDFVGGSLMETSVASKFRNDNKLQPRWEA